VFFVLDAVLQVVFCQLAKTVAIADIRQGSQTHDIMCSPQQLICTVKNLPVNAVKEDMN